MPARTPTKLEYTTGRKRLIKAAAHLGFPTSARGTKLAWGALSAIAQEVGVSRQMVSYWWCGSRVLQNRVLPGETAAVQNQGVE